MVPLSMQQDVYRSLHKREGSRVNQTWASWWRAQARAIDWVARREYSAKADMLQRVLERELAFAMRLEDRP